MILDLKSKIFRKEEKTFWEVLGSSQEIQWTTPLLPARVSDCLIIVSLPHKHDAMDRYQKVEKPKPELPISENEIRITSQGAIRNYITYASTLLQVYFLLIQSHFSFISIFRLHSIICFCFLEFRMPIFPFFVAMLRLLSRIRFVFMNFVLLFLIWNSLGVNRFGLLGFFFLVLDVFVSGWFAISSFALYWYVIWQLS